VLIIFLIPTTLIFHDFWTYEGAAAQNQMQHFMKNLSIMGGLLFVLGTGSGCCSIDAWLRNSRAKASESG
jgi:putative oxidoreductase